MNKANQDGFSWYEYTGKPFRIQTEAYVVDKGGKEHARGKGRFKALEPGDCARLLISEATSPRLACVLKSIDAPEIVIPIDPIKEAAVVEAAERRPASRRKQSKTNQEEGA